MQRGVLRRHAAATRACNALHRTCVPVAGRPVEAGAPRARRPVPPRHLGARLATAPSLRPSTSTEVAVLVSSPSAADRRGRRQLRPSLQGCCAHCWPALLRPGVWPASRAAAAQDTYLDIDAEVHARDRP